MQIFIRRMTPEDFDAVGYLQAEIQALHEQSRPDLFRTGAVSYDREAFRKIAESPDGRCAVCESKGKIIGFLIAWVRRIRSHRNLNNADVLLVDDICVAGAEHRRGVGRALWDHAEAAAKEAGCARIELNVYAFNENAIRFYGAMGLKPQILRMEKRSEAHHEI